MSEKTKVYLKPILPSLPDSRDNCVQRLTALLRREEGIDDVHLVEEADAQSPQICIHFAPESFSIAEVRALAQKVGMKLEERYGHLIVRSAAMSATRAQALEARLRKLPGVLDAVVAVTGAVRVEFDREITTEENVSSVLSGVGEVADQTDRIVSERTSFQSQELDSSQQDEEEGSHHSRMFGEWTELTFAGLSGGLLLIGWLISLTSANPWISWTFAVVSYVFGGYFTLREAIENIQAKRFEIDSLMLLAAIGAAALGEWLEGALLLFLFSLGHALEHYAMGRAKRAIEALSELAPQTALVRREGVTNEVRVTDLQKGDVIIVKPNERISADGFVIKGESSVNQAPITGESVPVDKRPVNDAKEAVAKADRLEAQYRVFAGTINESGALEIQVTKLSTESTLARVVQMVSEAETQKSPTQRFTERFERYFVPGVIAFVGVLLFAWILVDEPFLRSFYRAMAVLVAASPCALAIATPSAVLSGVARAARGGVLVKGGGPLESLGTVGAIAFDKTGTLTEGSPQLTDVVPFSPASDQELLRTAVAVEALSDHPLADAVVTGGRERLNDKQVPEAHDLKSITGRGVQATVEARQIHIGKDILFNEIAGTPVPDTLQKEVDRLEGEGRTTMIVRADDRYLGVLGMMDTPRKAAKSVIESLRRLGVERMVLLSGDNPRVAEAVAKEVGIDEAIGDLMPNDKVAAIQRLGREQGVAMVGDGVNDAPALANATVGIAMGAAGSDVALETADVALMADDLMKLPFAIGLSRQTRRVIRQNLWFSLGMVAFLIPATLFGLRMGAAVIFHEGSTLLVVFNALRLLAYPDTSTARNP